jgi:hypothetical protein
MKRSILISVLTATIVLPMAGCSMWPGNRSSDNRSSDGRPGPMTMQQCRDHMAMSANPNMRKDDMSARRDAECAAMMRR